MMRAKKNKHTTFCNQFPYFLQMRRILTCHTPKHTAYGDKSQLTQHAYRVYHKTRNKRAPKVSNNDMQHITAPCLRNEVQTKKLPHPNSEQEYNTPLNQDTFKHVLDFL